MGIAETKRADYNSYLTRILQSLHQDRDFMRTLDRIETDILEMFAADRLTIYQTNILDGMLVSRYKTGNDLKEIKIKLGVSSISGFVGLSRKPLRIEDVYDSESLLDIDESLKFNDSFDKKSGFKSGAMLLIPILKNEALLGVMQLINAYGRPAFTESDQDHAVELATFIGHKFGDLQNITQSFYDYLVQQDLISESLLAKLSKKTTDADALGKLIIKKTGIDKTELGISLAHFYQVPFLGFEPDKYWMHPIAMPINIEYFRSRNFALLTDKDDSLIILLNDPSDDECRNEIQNIIGNEAGVIYIGLNDDIVSYLEPEAAKQLTTTKSLSTVDKRQFSLAANTVSVNKQQELNTLLQDAIKHNATTIHLEPDMDMASSQLRVRVDGSCQQLATLASLEVESLICQLKILTKLDINSYASPQKGTFTFKLDEQHWYITVNFIPVIQGESVVIHLTPLHQALSFEQLKLPDEQSRQIKEVVNNKEGLFLVVGAEKSVLNSNLHSILNLIEQKNKKVWTVEKKINITQKGIQQVKIDDTAGLSSSRAIESVLQADPDILLIDNICDRESAITVLEGALNTSIIVSGVEGNSIEEGILQLVGFGVDQELLAKVLLGVLVLNRENDSQMYELLIPSDKLRALIREQAGIELVQQKINEDTLRSEILT